MPAEIGVEIEVDAVGTAVMSCTVTACTPALMSVSLLPDTSVPL